MAAKSAVTSSTFLLRAVSTAADFETSSKFLPEINGELAKVKIGFRSERRRLVFLSMNDDNARFALDQPLFFFVLYRPRSGLNRPQSTLIEAAVQLKSPTLQ